VAPREADRRNRRRRDASDGDGVRARSAPRRRPPARRLPRRALHLAPDRRRAARGGASAPRAAGHSHSSLTSSAPADVSGSATPAWRRCGARSAGTWLGGRLWREPGLGPAGARGRRAPCRPAGGRGRRAPCRPGGRRQPGGRCRGHPAAELRSTRRGYERPVRAIRVTAIVGLAAVRLLAATVAYAAAWPPAVGAGPLVARLERSRPLAGIAIVAAVEGSRETAPPRRPRPASA
jgi:hypothetical protein